MLAQGALQGLGVGTIVPRRPSHAKKGSSLPLQETAGEVKLMAQQDEDLRGRTALRKVTLRLLPFLCLLFIINILDRLNIGFARLQMLQYLHLSETAFALGAGIFYIGYFVLEVPSNLVLSRLGARRWIARIMISWGLISAGMMFVTGPWSFVVLRFLLGCAEAGFFPGIVLYLTYWFPAPQRARAMALFMVAAPLVGIAGGPVSGWLLKNLHQTAGLAGWQWLFLIEGLPAVVLGVIVFFYLTDRPEQARWLTAGERLWLSDRLAKEEKERKERHGSSLLQTTVDSKVWHLILLFITIAMCNSGLAYYLPKLIQDRFPGRDEFEIGKLVAVPSFGTIVLILVVGIHSDRTGERRWHIAAPALLAAAGWAMYICLPVPELGLLGLTLAQAGMQSTLPPFWALPTSFLSGRAAAGGIAMINAFGNLGGFAGPIILGQSREITGSFGPGMTVMSGILLVSAGLALCVRREPATLSPQPSPTAR